MNHRQIEDKQFVIMKVGDQVRITIAPKAVESCMNPGTFLITPIEIMEEESVLIFSVGKETVVIYKKEIEEGNVIIDELPYKPQVIRKKTGCNPCINCGRCSW